MRRASLIGYAGFAISIALLWWALRDTHLDAILARARGVDIGLMAIAIAAGTASIPLRAVRWRAALSHLTEPPSFGAMYHATAIGALANNVLPARTGEVVAASICARLGGVRLATAGSSLGMTHVLDVAVVVGLGAIGLIVSPPSTTSLDGDNVRRLLVGGIILALVLLVVLVALAFRRNVSESARTGLVGRVTALFESAVDGLGSLRSPSALAQVTGATTLVWIVTGLGWFVGLRSLGLDVSLGAALLVQSVVALGIALPSSPGFFGPFEAAARLALGLYLTDSAGGAEASVVFHVFVFFLPVIAAGLVSLLTSGVDLGAVRRSSTG